MGGNLKTKSIVFNLDDPIQRGLYDFAQARTTNFSNYIKSLIQRDMEGGQAASVAKKDEPIVVTNPGSFL